MTLRTLLTGMILLVFLSTVALNGRAAPTGANQVGQVHFPTSCSGEAQVHFDRAVALLHSFWFPAAITAFYTVLETDASCAMGYWGIAISLLGNPLVGVPTPEALEEGASILRQAKPVGVQTEREYDYLVAIALLYKDVESTTQRSEPNRFKSLYGAARAAELAGEPEKARAFYNKLMALAELADSERPELDEAKTFLAQP